MRAMIRPAVMDDLAAIHEIYDDHVLHTVNTFQMVPLTAAERRAWFAEHDDRYPLLVAEAAPEAIAGWASLSPFRPRAAYAQTVEDSIYIHPEHQRRGIGRLLMSELIRRAEALDYHVVMACIAGEAAASIAFHAAIGFVECGRLCEVSRKSSRWLDVVYMQLMLAKESPPCS